MPIAEKPKRLTSPTQSRSSEAGVKAISSPWEASRRFNRHLVLPGRARELNTPCADTRALSFSEQKDYDDQIVIVDGIGITHFIPRRASSKKADPVKKQKRRSRKSPS
jgi:hypothetical protein